MNSEFRDLYDTVNNLLTIAEDPKSQNIVLRKEDQAHYTVDKIRPKQLDGNGELHKFKGSDREINKLINSSENKLSNISSSTRDKHR